MLLLALLARVFRPGLLAVVLAALTGWTALSHVWSASPAAALDEAQRVALYAAVAAAVQMCGRWIPTWSVVAGTSIVACWNLVTRIGGVGHSTGAGSGPVGYANALALVCVLGIVLLPAQRRLWWIAGVPLVAVLVLQHSAGAYAALVAGAAMFVVRGPRLRLLLVAAAIAVLLAAPFLTRGNARSHYWRAAMHEARAHPVLGGGAGTYVNWWVRDRDIPIQTQEAHSLYVETLAELGPLGLALVVAALAIPLATARRPEIAAGVAAYAVAVAVDFDWELAGATVPFVILAALAGRGSRPARIAARRAVVPLAAAVAVAALLAYAGSAKLASAQDAAQRGNFAVAVTDARAALRWQPYSPQPWLVIGDVTHSADAYRHAVRLDPADWQIWQRLASVEHGRLRRLAEAQAAQLNPMHAG